MTTKHPYLACFLILIFLSYDNSNDVNNDIFGNKNENIL